MSVRLPAAALLTLAAFAVPSPAQAAMKTCYDRGYENLAAYDVRCDTAQRVYKTSLRRAAEQGGASVSFKFVGLRWRCRARNTSIYEWRCTASKGRLVRYRYLAGE